MKDALMMGKQRPAALPIAPHLLPRPIQGLISDVLFVGQAYLAVDDFRYRVNA